VGCPRPVPTRARADYRSAPRAGDAPPARAPAELDLRQAARRSLSLGPHPVWQRYGVRPGRLAEWSVDRGRLGGFARWKFRRPRAATVRSAARHRRGGCAPPGARLAGLCADGRVAAVEYGGDRMRSGWTMAREWTAQVDAALAAGEVGVDVAEHAMCAGADHGIAGLNRHRRGGVV